jgi:cytochrome P450
VDLALLGDREVSVADLPRLTFLTGVMQETLRLYPPAWILTRRSTAPARLGGVALPEGASLFFAPYGLQRDPDVFPDPAVFDPDRWLTGRAVANPSFVPFGGVGASASVTCSPRPNWWSCWPRSCGGGGCRWYQGHRCGSIRARSSSRTTCR